MLFDGLICCGLGLRSVTDDFLSDRRHGIHMVLAGRVGFMATSMLSLSMVWHHCDSGRLSCRCIVLDRSGNDPDKACIESVARANSSDIQN